jgi:hypothetical protein
MSDEEKIKLAKEATRHALRAISDDPRKYWLLGPLTGTWDKLTAAHAALWEVDEEEVQSRFQPEEKSYKLYCEQIEAEQELAGFCQDRGITLPQLLEWLDGKDIQIESEATS